MAAVAGTVGVEAARAAAVPEVADSSAPTRFAISRQREFEADRVGAEILGRPLPLANALKRLDYMAQRIPMNVAPAAAPLQSGNWSVNTATS